MEDRKEQMRVSVNQKMIEKGEKERLRNLLRNELSMCGWREQVKKMCREQVEKKGLDKISVQELIETVEPAARRTIPEEVKRLLLQEIRNFVMTETAKE